MTKTISLSDDAYEVMAGARKPGESFSALARRAFGSPKGSILELAGAWKSMTKREADELLRTLYAGRDDDRTNAWEAP